MSIEDAAAHGVGHAAGAYLDEVTSNSSDRTRWGCWLILLLISSVFLLWLLWPPARKHIVIHQVDGEHHVLTIEKNDKPVYPNPISARIAQHASSDHGIHLRGVGFTVANGDRLLVISNRMRFTHSVSGFWYHTVVITLSRNDIAVSYE